MVTFLRVLRLRVTVVNVQQQLLFMLLLFCPSLVLPLLFGHRG
jgi:hypothetical protein